MQSVYPLNCLVGQSPFCLVGAFIYFGASLYLSSSITRSFIALVVSWQVSRHHFDFDRNFFGVMSSINDKHLT